MAFIDEIKLHIAAGNGGGGVVRWRREKGIDKGGPAGGNGGRGGNIYVVALRDIGILARYKTIKSFEAEKGEDGMQKSRHGKNGKDLVIEFPIGSVITNLNTGKRIDLLKEGEKILLLEGGRGGLGNEHFKASTNVAPKESTPGKEGESGDFLIELELVADAGLIGLPNAGKSSLLNVLTKADAKVGDYAFTTLEPNLGALYGYVLADIPGLIEGASEGKGLGHKFLRHIRRTKALIHCISLENADLLSTYQTIRKELELFDPEMMKKPEVIVLTKTDLVDKKAVTASEKKMKKYAKEVYAVSIIDDESIKAFQDSLLKYLKSL